MESGESEIVVFLFIILMVLGISMINQCVVKTQIPRCEIYCATKEGKQCGSINGIILPDITCGAKLPVPSPSPRGLP